MFSYAPPPVAPVELIDTRERTQSAFSRTVYSELIAKENQSTDSSNYLSDRRAFRAFSSAITELLSIGANWNSYNSETPAVTAVKNAQSILNILEARLTLPARVLPSADGGVSIIFSSQTTSRAIIECTNDQEQTLVLYDLNGNVKTYDWPLHLIDEQNKLIDEMRNHLRSQGLAASSISS